MSKTIIFEQLVKQRREYTAGHKRSAPCPLGDLRAAGFKVRPHGTSYYRINGFDIEQDFEISHDELYRLFELVAWELK